MEDASRKRNNPPSEPHVQVRNNKRKLSVSGDDDMDIYNSYVKIRALVRQLRPHFVQVLQTPDFRNCQAAHEIREKLKLVSDLCKQMTVESDTPANLVTEKRTLSGGSVAAEQATCKLKEKKEAELLKTEHYLKNPTDMKGQIPSSSSERKLNDGTIRTSYVVGGSVFGWNFITYGGSKPVYYGPLKDSYLRRKMKSSSPS